MKTVLEASHKLEKLANKKGYVIYGTPFDQNYVNQTKKTIVMNATIDDTRNIKTSHELGHIYIFKIWKWFVVINEFTAWLIGWFICKVNGINTKNFWAISKECLKTYIKQ